MCWCCREVKRIGTQPGEYADIALWRRRPLLVVHGERQLATVVQRAHAALNHIPYRIALEDLDRNLKRISSSAD